MRTFTIRPFGEDCETILYDIKDTSLSENLAAFSFNTGITVLIGCNGSGKTTLMKRMINVLEKNDIPTYKIFANELENSLHNQAYYSSDVNILLTLTSKNDNSEGEYESIKIAHNLQYLRSFVEQNNPNTNERWIFFDGLDSSLSEDRLDETINLFNTIILTAPKNLDIYIVATTNQFAIANNQDCINVISTEHLKPQSYEEYRETILETAKRTKNRNKISDEDWEDTFCYLSDDMRDN